MLRLAAARHWTPVLGQLAVALARGGGLSRMGVGRSARVLRGFGMLGYTPHALLARGWEGLRQQGMWQLWSCRTLRCAV